MSAARQGQHFNCMLAGLPDKERLQVLEHCELVDLVFGEILCPAGQYAEYVYFPETSILGLVTVLAGHAPLGIALIGNEGMLGVVLVLSDEPLPMRGAMVQNAGTALRMKASRFRQQLHDSPIFLLKLKHYLYSLIEQIAQSIGCIHFHEIEPRLARWLLMTQDRSRSEHFHLTHDQLADMLGVRRSGVTIAAGALQNKKLITYSRGNIIILDRKGLEASACECYCAVKKQRRRR